MSINFLVNFLNLKPLSKSYPIGHIRSLDLDSFSTSSLLYFFYLKKKKKHSWKRTLWIDLIKYWIFLFSLFFFYIILSNLSFKLIEDSILSSIVSHWFICNFHLIQSKWKFILQVFFSKKGEERDGHFPWKLLKSYK